MANKDVKENKQKRRYFKDMKAELKKVVWPTPKQTINNTVAVVVFTLIIALIVFVLDLCFDSINKYGVTPLQEKVQSSYNASHNEIDETSENAEGTANEENTDGSDAENVEVNNEENNTEESGNEESAE